MKYPPKWIMYRQWNPPNERYMFQASELEMSHLSPIKFQILDTELNYRIGCLPFSVWLLLCFSISSLCCIILFLEYKGKFHAILCWKYLISYFILYNIIVKRLPWVSEENLDINFETLLVMWKTAGHVKVGLNTFYIMMCPWICCGVDCSCFNEKLPS